MQANVVRPQLPHEFKTRQIIIQSGANVWPHEMKTAEALAAAGRTVEFIRRSEEQRTTSADAIIDGIVWEMKAPKASNLKAIDYCSAFATPFHAPLLQRSMADCHTLTI
ncbi:hypothetical protein [Adlercreutzia rubneri]